MHRKTAAHDIYLELQSILGRMVVGCKVVYLIERELFDDAHHRGAVAKHDRRAIEGNGAVHSLAGQAEDLCPFRLELLAKEGPVLPCGADDERSHRSGHLDDFEFSNGKISLPPEFRNSASR